MLGLHSGSIGPREDGGKGRAHEWGVGGGRQKEEREKTAGIKSSLKRDEIRANGRGREEAPCKDE